MHHFDGQRHRQGQAAAERIGPSEHRLHAQSAAVDLAVPTQVAQLLGQNERLLPRWLGHRRQVAIWSWPGLVVLHQREDPLDPHGEADRRNGLLAAQPLHHAVVAASAQQGVLTAQRPAGLFELEEGTGVVVETSHQLGIHHIGHLEGVQVAQEPLKMIGILTVEQLDHAGRPVDGFAVLRSLGVENP